MGDNREQHLPPGSYPRQAASTLAAWALRVASKPEDGGGHVRRCIALGHALVQSDPVLFVLDKGGEVWLKRLADDGFAAVIEGDEGEHRWSGCILDGYNFSAADAQRWKSRTGFLVDVDDCGSPRSIADLAVCPTADSGHGDVSGVPALTGLRHALVKPPPALIRHRRNLGGRRILVSFGMRDSHNATGIALAALSNTGDGGLAGNITVAMGADAPHLQAVRDMASAIGAKLVVDAPGLYGLLADADCMIGSGGVSLLEGMACGIPSVTVCTADNQRRLVALAADAGGTIDAGPVGSVAERALAEQVLRLVADIDAQTVMSDRAKELVDGGGADRVSAAIVRRRRLDAADSHSGRRETGRDPRPAEARDF